MRAIAAVLLLIALMPFAVADDAAPAAADAAAAPVIFKGTRGLAPVQVVYDYLKDRIADEHGLADYQSLAIRQQAKGEAGEQVQMEVVLAGLKDDAVASQRYQLGLVLADSGWDINSARQDWKCRRGGKGWTTKPCK
ncbi:hypothetical protein IGB42_02839 [Andreprevotia sp. IGB-42]|uniref:hypothetical protein n=1 Tax=Andreprevotia sp. IGB-42 TaxID=2497473 RepID=UPI001359A6F1|nr:hypothetical protein [Andreprevotia sp. IGB-42]KAF0812550.1 hypothetical protein IGB42_02839 [Andreprevotia sp. IGB-42]